ACNCAPKAGGTHGPCTLPCTSRACAFAAPPRRAFARSAIGEDASCDDDREQAAVERVREQRVLLQPRSVQQPGADERRQKGRRGAGGECSRGAGRRAVPSEPPALEDARTEDDRERGPPGEGVSVRAREAAQSRDRESGSAA